MNSIAAQPVYTPEDLLQLPDGELYELVDGQLVERNMGANSVFTSGKIYSALDNYCTVQKRGWAFTDGLTYQCFPDDPEKVRKPDASVVLFGRFPGFPEGHIRIPPDLAIEVVSPRDTAYDLDTRVEEYLKAGVKLIWVINPATRTVKIYRPNGMDDATLRNGDLLTGGTLLAGFECRVSDLFAMPARG